MDPETFNQHSPGVTLEEDGTVAIHDRDRTEYRYILGQNIYQQGTHRIRLNLETFRDHFWMFNGILKRDVDVRPDNASNLSHGWSGSYGWGLGREGREWRDGEYENRQVLDNVVKEGNIVKLVLDCAAGNMSLHWPDGQQLHIEIPESETWRLHVNLFNQGDKIRLVRASQRGEGQRE